MSKLMVRGDLTGFEVDTGRGEPKTVLCPDSYGLVHDPSGSILGRCELYVAKYHIDWDTIPILKGNMRKTAEDYFGDLERIRACSVDVPNGPWDRVGNVSVIYYARYGTEDPGRYHHPVKPGVQVDLYRQRRGKAFRLSLPNNCIISYRGFIYP